MYPQSHPQFYGRLLVAVLIVGVLLYTAVASFDSATTTTTTNTRAQVAPWASVSQAQGGDDEDGETDEDPTPTPGATNDATDSERTADDDAAVAGSVETDDEDAEDVDVSETSSSEDEAFDAAQLAAVAVAGAVAGIAGTTLIMRRRIKRLQQELREAQIVIQAVQPARRQRRPRGEPSENSPRSIAAAKKIGGQSLLRTGQSREAYMMFLDAIEQDEDDDEAWLWAGIAAMKLKQYEVAQQTLLQARTLGNEKAEDALRKLKELIERRARIESLTTLQPASTEEPELPPIQAPKRSRRNAKSGKAADEVPPVQKPPRSLRSASQPADSTDEIDAEPDFDF